MYTRNLNYKKLIEDFLNFKRACRYKYFSEETILKAFYNYTQEYSESSLGLSQDFLNKWSILGVREGRKSLANRVSVIRELGIYLTNQGYKVHILRSVKNATNKSFIPYVFSKKEIEKIFLTIDTWHKSQHNSYNSNEVYPILFRMLYGCGLRISEALHLKIKNVDTESGKVIVDVAKNDKQRIVMMNDSLRKICHEYKHKYLLNVDQNSTFFRHKDGKIRTRNQVNNFFRQILYKSDIPYLGRGKGPYLHNLRHTFACHTFYQMSKNGIDMNVGITLVSSYLGHESPQATERYLKLTQEVFPELMLKITDYSSDIYREVIYE